MRAWVQHLYETLLEPYRTGASAQAVMSATVNGRIPRLYRVRVQVEVQPRHSLAAEQAWVQHLQKMVVQPAVQEGCHF